MGSQILTGLGRMMISAIFIILGIAAIYHWELAETDLTSALANWELYAGHIEGGSKIFTALGTAIPFWMGAGVALQIVGGSLVFLSIRVRTGALLLLLYLIPATVLYHHFWFLEGAAEARSLVLFLKNISIMGGLMVILGMGGGKPKKSANPPPPKKS